MKQMSLDGMEIIEIDHNWSYLPESFRELRPALYKDGEVYCCLLGPDPQAGIFGCGNSPEDAVIDWDVCLKEQLLHSPNPSEVIGYVRNIIAMEKKEAC